MFITPRYIFVLPLVVFSSTVLQAADMPERGPVPFEVFDKNGDKMISPQEFVETHNMRMKQRSDAGMPAGRMAGNMPFTFFDTNGDNLISPEELKAAREKMQQQRGGMGQGMGQGMGPGMGQGRQMPSFADFDLNGDGAMTSEEFNEARGKRMQQRAEQGYQMRNAPNAPAFEDIDTNADGKVTPDEFKAHQAARMQMRRME